MEVLMNNKKIIKLFSCTTLILCILVSYSSLSFATDDSLYVWSSTSNSLLNILDDNIKHSNTTTNNSNTSKSTNNSTNSTSNNINVNSNNTNNNKTNTNSNNTNSSDNSLETSAIADVTDNNSLNLESASAILIEQSSGRILYAHNIHEQLRPASVTKVMSILLIMEALDSGKLI